MDTLAGNGITDIRDAAVNLRRDHATCGWIHSVAAGDRELIVYTTIEPTKSMRTWQVYGGYPVRYVKMGKVVPY